MRARPLHAVAALPQTSSKSNSTSGPASETRRTSEGQFHSVDPGKLTMAPYFAEICAARISSAD